MSDNNSFDEENEIDKIYELDEDETIKCCKSESFKNNIISVYKNIELSLRSREMCFDEFSYMRQELKRADKFNNIYQLDLSDCENLVKISGLKNTEILDISENIKKVEKLVKLKELSMRNWNKIKDISGLDNLEYLDILDNINVKDIGNLRNLKEMKIKKMIEGLHLLKI